MPSRSTLITAAWTIGILAALYRVPQAKNLINGGSGGFFS